MSAIHDLIMLFRLMRNRAALLAQCPPAQPVMPGDATRFPVHVDRVGTVGPRLLMIHGGIQSGMSGGPSTLVKQKELADKGWRVELVDRPGFGNSPSRGVDDMVADSNWIADMLQGGAHLLGHSWGGAASLLAAAKRPESVQSLILIEPALQGLAMLEREVRRNPDAKKLVMSTMNIFISARTPVDLARALARELGVAGENQAVMGTRMTDDILLELGAAFLRARMASPRALMRAAAIVSKHRIPTLVITGGWSKAIDTVAASAARCIGGELVVIPAPNHFVQLENPMQCNQVIDAFLQKHGGNLAVT